MHWKDNTLGQRSAQYLNDPKIFTLRTEISVLRSILDDLLSRYAAMIDDDEEGKSSEDEMKILNGVIQIISEITKAVEKGQKVEDRSNYAVPVHLVHQWQLAIASVVFQVLASTPALRKELLSAIYSLQLPDGAVIEGQYKELEEEAP